MSVANGGGLVEAVAEGGGMTGGWYPSARILKVRFYIVERFACVCLSVCICLFGSGSQYHLCIIYTRPQLLVVLLIACRSRIHVATHNEHQQASRSAVLKISWSYPEFGTVMFFKMLICHIYIYVFL